jgi:hypothetical protein
MRFSVHVAVEIVDGPDPVSNAAAPSSGMHTPASDRVLESADAHGDVGRRVTERQVGTRRRLRLTHDVSKTHRNRIGQRINIGGADARTLPARLFRRALSPHVWARGLRVEVERERVAGVDGRRAVWCRRRRRARH